MRKILFILTVAMIIMAVIIIPVGISNIVLALQLGLLFESVSSLFFLCLFIAFCLFEIKEFIEEYSWYYEEIPIEGMHDADEEDPISRRCSKMDIPENIFLGRLFVCLHCWRVQWHLLIP